MKALILSFSAFNGKKDPSKAYFRFDMFDLEGKMLYNIFQEQQYTAIPEGTIPSPQEQVDTFPRVAEVDFSVDQYRTKEGRTAYQPRVRAIKFWKTIDLKKL